MKAGLSYFPGNVFILTHAYVTADTFTDVSGLVGPTLPYFRQYPTDSKLATFDYNGRGSGVVAGLAFVDSYLTKSYENPSNGTMFPVNFYDLSTNPKTRSINLKATYIYEGGGCSTRQVTIPTSIQVLVPLTHDLTHDQNSDLVIEDFINRRLSTLDFLTRETVISNLKTSLNFWRSTSTHPLEVLPQKGGKIQDFYQAMNSHPESSFSSPYFYVGSTTMDSSDGCVSDSNGDTFISPLNVKDFYKTNPSGSCAFTIHLAPLGDFSEQLVIQGWLSAIPAPLAMKTTITCIKGKLVKTVTAVKPACPAGYRKK
jgi:hypothetical protein